MSGVAPLPTSKGMYAVRPLAMRARHWSNGIGSQERPFSRMKATWAAAVFRHGLPACGGQHAADQGHRLGRHLDLAVTADDGLTLP